MQINGYQFISPKSLNETTGAQAAQSSTTVPVGGATGAKVDSLGANPEISESTLVLNNDVIRHENNPTKHQVTDNYSVTFGKNGMIDTELITA